MSETLQSHEAMYYLLQHSGDILERQLDQALQEQLGVGMSQYKILMLLEQGSEHGQRSLADSLGQTEAAVSRQIKVLGQKGLLQGRINEKNRREHLVAITPKGIKVSIAARQAIERSMTSLDGMLTEKQRKQLKELLVIVHAWTCKAGNKAACNHPFDM